MKIIFKNKIIHNTIMKTTNLLLFISTYYSFFINTCNSFLLFKQPYINYNKLFIHNNLKDLDDEMDTYLNKLKSLRHEKRMILSDIKGLKISNHTNFDDLKNENYDDDDDMDMDEIGNNDNYNNDNYNNDNYNNNIFNKNKNIKKSLQQIFPQGIRVVINNKPPEQQQSTTNSENFQIILNSNSSFKDIGGCEHIKNELMQCADLLINYEKYKKYNVRTPKGLILEGPPGNGKTLLAKCFSGEIKVGFISVSGSQFQEKYVGVGASRIRELFKLAMDNKPCIIFIDEIDALGRKRDNNEMSTNSERDDTLNELLVNLDGFKSTEGIFIIGATNRVDLLDSALIRPGRIDKNIYVGNPNRESRDKIIDIHINGKPHHKDINKELLLEMTQGFSGAQIENLLNEAMLYALRNNREEILIPDLEFIVNRILVGWQSSESIISNEMLYQIAVHELGHAVVGLLTDYKKLVKVSLNLWSPKTPGYTLFETSDNDNNMYTKDKLISHLMVLLGGRIAEEELFNGSITTGASHDLEEAKKLAEKMIITYGMGNNIIYPFSSDKYKEIIDNEISTLLETAYNKAKFLIINSKGLIEDCSKILVDDHTLFPEIINKKINNKYSYLLNIKNKI